MDTVAPVRGGQTAHQGTQVVGCGLHSIEVKPGAEAPGGWLKVVGLASCDVVDGYLPLGAAPLFGGFKVGEDPDAVVVKHSIRIQPASDDLVMGLSVRQAGGKLSVGVAVLGGSVSNADPFGDRLEVRKANRKAVGVGGPQPLNPIKHNVKGTFLSRLPSGG